MTGSVIVSRPFPPVYVFERKRFMCENLCVCLFVDIIFSVLHLNIPPNEKRRVDFSA